MPAADQCEKRALTGSLALLIQQFVKAAENIIYPILFLIAELGILLVQRTCDYPQALLT